MNEQSKNLINLTPVKYLCGYIPLFSIVFTMLIILVLFLSGNMAILETFEIILNFFYLLITILFLIGLVLLSISYKNFRALIFFALSFGIPLLIYIGVIIAVFFFGLGLNFTDLSVVAIFLALVAMGFHIYLYLIYLKELYQITQNPYFKTSRNMYVYSLIVFLVGILIFYLSMPTGVIVLVGIGGIILFIAIVLNLLSYLIKLAGFCKLPNYLELRT